MKNSLNFLCSVMVLLILQTSPSLFGAVNPITISNPSFESPILVDNQSLSTVPGWNPVGNVSFFGAWNPPTTCYPSEAPDGQNVGVIYLSSAFTGCSQTIQGAVGQFQANSNYELKVKVGGGCTVFGVPRPYDGYMIQLVVNGVVIAQDDNSNVPATGSFVTSTLKYYYDSTSHSGLVGYPIEIRLLSKGLGSGNGIVSFDDVQLTYDTSNAVANHGGPYRLSGTSSSLSLNGLGSTPSSGASSITTYEWDLNSNDNGGVFNSNITGATPTTISYATLTGTYGMAFGTNTIRLRITDNLGQTAVSATTVNIFEQRTYLGPNTSNGNTERWNVTGNWTGTAIPSGLVDVVIPSSKFLPCLSATTPEYTGNLTIGTNSQLSLGWTTSGASVANSLGTPGSTVITMESGSSINFRIGGTPYVPAIALNGNASVTLGSSTQTGAQASFNYPITGSYRLSFYGNSTQNCVANMNNTNTFNEIYTAGGPYVDGGVTLVGNAPGSLGTGNLNLNALTGGGNSGVLIINAENAMADSATLTMNGNSATKITMNANDTISRLIINGAQMPAGTYGSNSSAATFKQTWISGTAILTVTEGQGNYWDINGAIAGAGGASPSATWDSAGTIWSDSTTGNTATAAWIAGRTAVFAAGSDATGPYTVTIGGSNAITVTNSFTSSLNTGSSSFNVTRSGWALNQGNCVAVMISSLNATGFTATYAGLDMTVVKIPGVYDSRNSYVGIAYIISDSLPTTGNVVISVPRVVPAINTGAYANMGTVYSILSLSNVASVGTAVTKVQASGNANMTYSTSVNNSFVLGIGSDSNWQNSLKTVVGTCSQIISRAKPAYFNTIQCYGYTGAAGSYTDVYSPSLTALITLPFNAKTTSNPLLSGEGQKISGLGFEEGSVNITGGKLELQTTGSFTSGTGVTGTITSQISQASTSGITKKGAGTVILSNNLNNYTGTTTIQNGTLRLGATNALPNTAVSIAGDSPGVTATLDLNGNSNTIAGLNFGGSSTTSGSSVTTGAGTLTLGGNVTFNSVNSPLGATISGNLSLGSANRNFDIKDSSTAINDLTISAITSGTGGINKLGFGTLHLSGNNTYTGPTTVSSGLLALSGSNNSAATGSLTVNDSGAVRFDALGAINGTGQNVTIQSGGLVYFGSSFGEANIPAALARINPSSSGVIALDNFDTSNFNFTTNSLNVYLGSISDITYSGNITPFGGAYRLGGGGGTITLAGAGALQTGNDLFVSGRVILANSYDLGTGNTSINSSGRLQLGTGGTLGSLASTSLINNGVLAFNRSDNLTQGTSFWSSISGSGILEKLGSGALVLNAANNYAGGTNLLAGTLLLNHSSAIGSGRLSIYSGTLDTSSPLTHGNIPITLLGSFNFGGTANLNMGSGSVDITGDHTITLNGTNKSLTFGGVGSNLSGGDQILTVNGTGNSLIIDGYNMSSDVNSFLVSLTIAGTGNLTFTDTVNDWTGGDPLYDYDPFDIRLGTLVKTGSGTLTLYGINNYTGNTVVNGGVLHLLNPSSSPPSQISHIIVNNGGILALTLGTTVHSSERLTLNTGHKIRIVGTVDPEVPSYTLMIADSIVGGTPTLETPIPDYFLEIAGNELRLTKSDSTPPELVDIVNDQGSGTTVGPILPNTLVTYTVTFNEDIKDSSLTSADFDNAGSIALGNITFGTITETSPGVFTVPVTPTVAGTLQLRIPVGAVIEDFYNNDLAVPLTDDTTVNVATPDNNWLVSSDIVDDKGGSPISPNTLVTYTLYFNRDIDHTTVTSADFVNAGGAAITIGTITEIEDGTFTVQITPTSFGTLQLSIPTTADIRDASNNILDNNPAILDDTEINVSNNFDSWAGDGNIFGDDLNQDGIANGLAWLLGATNPNENAKDLLPAIQQTAGNLTTVFYTLDAATRGTASIKVQYSNDLGITDFWSNNEAEVPGTPGTSTVNGIEFTTQDVGGGLLYVEATIPESEAGVGKKLFTRLKATTP